MGSPSPFKVQAIDILRSGITPATVYAIRDARNINIAMVGQVDAATDNGEARDNARLFALAPTLLNDLEDIVRTYRDNAQLFPVFFESFISLAEQTIEKAKGI